MKRFNVVSIHFTNECNLDCPFCYRENGKDTMDEDLFYGLPEYLSDVTDQVALGGGEPTLYPEMVENFAAECKKYDLVCNLTTNGLAVQEWTDEEIGEFCKDLTMVSVSLDKEKARHWGSMQEYLDVSRKIQKYTMVGCNLLVDEDMFENAGLIELTDALFENRFDRVFSLYPKNVYFVDVIPRKNYYLYLSTKYPDFFVDDLTYKILDENKYSDWKTPCHHGKDIVNINERGEVSGCSFCNDYKLRLRTPEDILKANDIVFEDRYSCPYIKEVIE